MSTTWIRSALIASGGLLFLSCTQPTEPGPAASEAPMGADVVASAALASASSAANGTARATGGLKALWVGCPDGEGRHGAGGSGGGGCSGGHDDGDHVDDGGCTDDHGDEPCDGDHTDEEGHEDGGCSGGGQHGQRARPARDFRLQFQVLEDESARGRVALRGLGEYRGVAFDGDVLWIEEGREINELFFGGKITYGTVDRGCFLFSVQDNGEGGRADADRMQYRLYGTAMAPCDHVPDHLPIGYPIEVYSGSLQVHGP